MRVLLTGIAVAIVIAVIAGIGFRAAREPVHEVFASSSVRLDNPGINLVGKNWTGNPSVTSQERRAATTDSKAGAVD
jgi:hypothetical protein